jgi:CBS domain-containing protein
MNAKDFELSEIITQPITVEPNKTILKIREILLEKRIKRVIVIDKKKPIGVITEKDIAKKIYKLGNKSIKEIKAKNFKPKNLFVKT